MTVYRLSEQELLQSELEATKEELDEARAEIKALNERMEALTGTIHPYNKNFHENRQCPFCLFKNGTKGSQEIKGEMRPCDFFVSITQGKATRGWFSPALPEHIVIHCHTCYANYRMRLPENYLGESK